MSSPRSHAWIRPSLLLLLMLLLPVGAEAITIETAIKVGRNPMRIAVGADNSIVYVANADDHTISIVDTRTARVLAVPVGGSPISLALSIDGARLYVGVSPKSLAIIDTATHQIKRLAIDDDAVDLAPTPDDKVVYIAMKYAGLQKLSVQQLNVQPVNDVPCPMALALMPTDRRLYVNYQCAPYTRRPGNDPIVVFDTQTERVVAVIHRRTTGKPIANVGGWMSMSPDGKFLWASGVDACSRPEVYDLAQLACPPLDEDEKPQGRGFFNIVDTSMNSVVHAIGFRATEIGSNVPLSGTVPTFFPEPFFSARPWVAVSTESRVLVFDARTTKQVDVDLRIPRAGNIVFSRDARRAFVASSSEGQLYVLELSPSPVWNKALAWYGARWRDDFGKTAGTHVTAALVLWMVLSDRFARTFARIPALRFLLELDVYSRGPKSRLAKIYLRQLAHSIAARRAGRGASRMVPLPVKGRNGRRCSEHWLDDVIRAVRTQTAYRGALRGVGGKGKTVLLEEATLHLIDVGRFPVVLQAVDYTDGLAFEEWLGKVLREARVPIRPSLLSGIPGLVCVIDQVSEVRREAVLGFWRLIETLFDPNHSDVKLIVAGRDIGDAATGVGRALPWDEIVDIDELEDDDIRALGSVYLDPDGESVEVQSLPAVIREIVKQPTAFIVSHYAKARSRSSRSIANRNELYQEILDQHVERSSFGIRPELVTIVLRELVSRYFGQTHNRGIPLDRFLLSRTVDQVFTELHLVRLYGQTNVPDPGSFVDRLISSGLVYQTSAGYLFFHDSFEDWLLEEAHFAISLK